MDSIIQKQLITCILLALFCATQSKFNCKDFDKCTCSELPIKGYELDCPSDTENFSKVKIGFVPKPITFEVDCKYNDDYFDHLPFFGETDAELFFFKTCSFTSNNTIHDIMLKLGVKSVNQMRISTSQLHNITRNYFENLEGLEQLQLIWNQMDDLPEDLIYDLKDLISFNMLQNAVEIPRNFFKHSRHLRSIELGQNFMPKNPGSMFENLSELLRLNIWGMGITKIDSELFKNLSTIQQLDLSRNQINNLSSDVFNDLENLQILSLRTNLLQELPTELFKNNKMLQKLYLEGNYNLKMLPEFLLANLTNLENVAMSLCNISELPENLLWGTINLNNLNLANNKIKSLPELLFQDTTQLQTLNLENNALESLPNNLFISLSKLTDLNLQNNFIALQKDTFFGLDSLKSLNLRNNKLKFIPRKTLKNVDQLVTLDLSSNQLTLRENNYEAEEYGEQSIMPNLEKLENLQLAHNDIEDIFLNWRINFPNLVNLDLSYNNLTAVEYVDFTFLQKNIIVNLQHNKIIDINMGQAESLVHINVNQTYRKNIKIKLEGNPIHCGCNIYHLTRYFDLTMEPEAISSVELIPGNLICATPEDISGTHITDIKSRYVICELNEELKMESGCPINSRCFNRPHDNTLVIDSSHLGISKVPLIAPIGNHNWTNIEVDLQGNKITTLPESGMGYEKVTKMDISHNMLRNVKWLPNNIQVLRLHNNNFTYLDQSELQLLNRSTLRNITLINNPWECNCNILNLTKYLQENFKKIQFLNNLTCQDTKRKLTGLTVSELCPMPTEIIIAFCVTIAVFSLILGIMAALYYRYQEEIKVWLYANQQCLWFVTEEELDKDKLYDAFISYSHKDEDFVVSELLPNLEDEPNFFKLCLHFRNWLPGEFITANIARSVAESRRTLVVLSPNFLASEWGKMEFRTAHIQALSEGRARVIVVLLGDIGPIEALDDELRAYLSTNTYVKWGDRWFWDKLKYAMPHSPRYSNNNNQALQKIKIFDDKLDLIHEPITPTVGTTPPADKMEFDQMFKNGALNVSLVNGTLINNAMANCKIVNSDNER